MKPTPRNRYLIDSGQGTRRVNTKGPAKDVC